jgi:hypothetical protein
LRIKPIGNKNILNKSIINVLKLKTPLDEEVTHAKISEYKIQIKQRCEITYPLCQHLLFLFDK